MNANDRGAKPMTQSKMNDAVLIEMLKDEAAKRLEGAACDHRDSTTTADGCGAYCAACGETLA